MQCVPEATKFGETTQNKGHYAVQGHSRHRFWYKLKALLVISISLPHILDRFRDIAFDRSKIAIFSYPHLRLTPPHPTDGFAWDDVRKIFRGYGQGTKWRRNIAENFNRLSRVDERYRQTDDRRTGDSI